MEHPSHLERGLPSNEDEVATPNDEEGAALIKTVEGARKKADHGLSLFQRIPKGMKGEELLDHQSAFRQREYAAKPEQHFISPALNVEARTSHQRSLMEIDYVHRVQGSLMADVNAGVPLEKAAQVRLDNLGLIKRHALFVNNPQRLERHRERLEMMRSLGLVQEMATQEAEEIRAAEKVALAHVLGAAIKMYQAEGTGKRTFQKKPARAILVSVFDVSPKKSLAKKELIEILEEEARTQPALIDGYEIEDAIAAIPSLPSIPESEEMEGIDDEEACALEAEIEQGLESLNVDEMECEEEMQLIPGVVDPFC